MIGDPDALAALLEGHRPWLTSLAYRMLGSVAEAEDVVQDAFVRILEAPSESIRAPKAYLATAVTRRCINHLNSAKVRRERYPGTWLPEPIVTDPQADPSERVERDETIRFAFLLVLESLTPSERAVFLLRDVFGFEYREVAQTVGLSEANCRQLLHRARAHIAAAKPPGGLPRRTHVMLLDRFLAAAATGEVDDLARVLAEGVVLRGDGGGRGPAVLVPVIGRIPVARLLRGAGLHLMPEGLVRAFADVNGTPGVVNFLDGRPFSTLTFDANAGGEIVAIYAVTNPDKLRYVTNPRAILSMPV